MSVYAVDKLLAEVRRLAVEYRKTTGKTLPLTAELAVGDACRLLGLTAVNEPDAGYDAVRQVDGAEQRVLVKGRAIFDPERSGHRMGQIRWDGPWDTVLLVLMDEAFEPVEIYEADRDTLAEHLDPAAGGKAGKKGGMSVAKFKIIGEPAWDLYQAGASAEAPAVPSERE